MKKLIALFVVLGLLVGVAGVFTADAAVKKAPVKKKVAAKKPVKKAAPKKAAPAPAAPAPVAPVPPPPPVMMPAPKAAAPAGLFGLGLNCDIAGLYINTGKGQLGGGLGLKGDLILDDPLALGAMVGLSASSVKYKLGLGYVQGGGGLKAVPLYLGGIIMLPGDLMGAQLYLDGGLNYVVTGNNSKSGNIGGDASIGILADLGLGLGKTGFLLGYSVVRSNNHTDKGLSFTVSQPFVL